MAYTSCAAKIAASIQQDCNKPLVGGYTGRAVMMSAIDFERAEVVRSANNPRKIMSIVLPPDGSVMAYTIDNVFAAPFTGSTTAGNTDNGRNGYLKTIAVRVPMRGADVSRDVIEPLVKDADGFVVIAEKRDKVGDGSYEVIGYQNALRGDIAGVTRDESANGGDWIVNLTTIEKWAEVTLVGSADTYESAKKEFEGLFGFEPNIIRFVFDYRHDQIGLSSRGDVYIDTIKAGAKERLKFSDLNERTILLDSDEDTEVVIYGDVTMFDAKGHENGGVRNLDVRQCKTLEKLHCSNCENLTSLDVSNNKALVSLECNYCINLTSLDVSKNVELTDLYCTGTGVTSLNVGNNKKLQYLFCGRMELTSLDVSKNGALIELNCENNTNLMLLDIQHTSMIDDLFLNAELPNLTTLQVAGTSESAYTALDEWFGEGGGAPYRGMLYVDENTPQSVITAAEAKEWEVIYVS